MYSNTDVLVKTPKSSDKVTIHILTTGYVLLATEYHWDSEKRCPVDKRISIGKIVDGDRSHMHPNKNYERFFGPIDAEVNRQKDTFGTKARKAAGKTDSKLSFGPYLVLKAAAEQSGCYTALTRVYPEYERKIIALAVYSIVAESSTAQMFPGWCFDHYCGLDRVIDDSEVSGLYRLIGSDEGNINVFFRIFREEYEKRFPRKDSNRVIAFDSTNQNTQSENEDLAEFGKSKTDFGLKIINTAMFVDEETGIPMWYEHYDGSLLDKVQTSFSLKKIVDAGYQKLFAMFDRGYFSEDVIKALRNVKDLEYGVLCPDNVNWVDELIKDHGAEIRGRQKYLTTEPNVFGKRYPVTVAGKACFAYLFFDHSREFDDEQSIRSTISYYFNEASKRKRYTEKMAQDYAPRGIIVVKKADPETGKNFTILEDTEMIQTMVDRAGFFVLVSDTEMTASEAIRIIRRRDVVEHVFESIKRHFDLSVTYTHSIETYRGKMFTAFIASILFATLTWDLREVLHDKTSATIAFEMMELNKYKVELQSDGSWYPSYAMSRIQKELISKVGLTEDEAINQATEIKLLV